MAAKKNNENFLVGFSVGLATTAIIGAIICLFSMQGTGDDHISRHNQVLKNIQFGNCVNVVDGFYRGATGLVEAPPNYGSISIQITKFNDYVDSDLSYNNWVVDVWAGNLTIVECNK